MLRRTAALAAALSGAVSLAACSAELPLGPTSAASAVAGSDATAAGASHSTEPMRVFSTGALLPGTSKLTRNKTGVSMTVHATGLLSGNVYTVWFVIFNSPDECVGGCGVDDVFANRGVPSLRHAAGHVVGESGNGDFGGHLAAQNTGGPPCAMDANLGICGPGLLDSHTAEIHIVVRSHGVKVPELVNEQTSSFGGGCQVNACANVQVAVHLPPDA